MTSGLWGYGNAEGYTPGTDLTGYRVEAEDGHIGKVDRHTAEVDSAHIVVDTGRGSSAARCCSRPARSGAWTARSGRCG
ncbi:hypothetical protein AB0D10_31010 [Kitasatospora sp. NPDC048545]|uniref:hypothetical protein n=1 Tax=Kitasatospora sp. NPDC048545 TaxID=3157208 RepID=UPI0033E7A6FD